MKNLARILIFLLVASPFNLLQAAPISSESLLGSAPAPQLSELQSALQQQQLRDRMVAMGVDPDQLQQRLATLTPDERRQLNAQIEEMPAGGLVGTLALIFIVFVITDALGATDLFTFVDPI